MKTQALKKKHRKQRADRQKDVNIMAKRVKTSENTHNSLPSYVKELEDYVRRGGFLQAIKIFKEMTGNSLSYSKEVLDKYRELGTWHHFDFDQDPKILERVFAEICGSHPENFIKDQHKRQDLLTKLEEYGTPIISVDMALRLARKYADRVLEEHKKIRRIICKKEELIMETIILISVLTTLGVVALVGALVVMFKKLNNKVNQQDVDMIVDSFNRDLNDVTLDLRKHIEEVEMATSSDRDHMGSHIDSRCDKLYDLIKQNEKLNN